MFQKFLKMFKNFQSAEILPFPSINTYRPCDPPAPPNPPPPPPPIPTPPLKVVFEKEPVRYFEGCGDYRPATEGSSYKGGINEGPSVDRPDPPTMTYKEKTLPSSKDDSITHVKIPLSPELVKGINEIIEENYESIWLWDSSREIETLYEAFRCFHYNFSRLSMKSLPKERVDLLTKVYYAMQALKDKHLSYKEYKSLKDLLNELYKSSAMRFYSPERNDDSIMPFTHLDIGENKEKMLMEQWGKKS